MLPANKVQDGYVTSGLVDAWSPEMPKGSFYLSLIDKLRTNIADHGDWVLLKNYITKETFRASQFETAAKKFAVILGGLGFQKGDALHVCIGNHNYCYALFGGVWTLGGLCSCGDVALDPNAIAGQVSQT